MANRILNARVTLRARGLELPPLDSIQGLAVNRLWTEVVRRERQLETVRVQHELLQSYAMAGLGPGIEWGKRYEFVEPLFKKLLAEVDQSAYRTQYQKAVIAQKVHRLMQRKAEVDRLEWLGSEDFAISDWLKGK